jgi:hypothetical protein
MTDIREVRRPLIPQFSLRWLLGLTTVCAFLFAVLGTAARGHAWAIGISVGMGAVVLMALVYAFFFACIWVASAVVRGPRAVDRGPGSEEGESPFRMVGAVGASPAGASSAGNSNVPIDAEILP